MTMVDPGPATRRLLEITGGQGARSIGPPEVAKSAREDAVYCYWRRYAYHPTEPGFIKKAPAWPHYFKKVSGQRWESLATEYGEFEDKWESGEEMVVDPFRHILLNGGSKEFPIKQIRELRWHRFPPRYIGKDGRPFEIVFPQLQGGQGTTGESATIDQDGNVVQDGVTLKDWRCPDCPGEVASSWFLSEVDMRRHQSVQHPQIAGSRQQASDFAKAIQGQNAPIQEAIGMMAQLLAHLTDAQRAAVMAQLGEQAPEQTKGKKQQE